jgi:hypothetical protein
MAPGPAGLKPSGGHFNPGRKDLRALSYVTESDGLVMATADGLRAAGRSAVAAFHTGRAAFLWCGPLPSPALEMLRTLAAQGEHFMDADELAAPLGKKPTGSHWNSGITVLRNMADRNRRSTLPNHDTLSRVNCLPYRSAQASKCRTLLVAYHKEQERYRKKLSILGVTDICASFKCIYIRWMPRQLIP